MAYEKGIAFVSVLNQDQHAQGVPDELNKDLAQPPNCKSPISPLQALSALF